MFVDNQPEKMLFNMPKNADSKEIFQMVDKYRVLMGLGWHDFIYIGFASVMREDNEELADAVLHYVKNRRKVGRPKGQSVKARLRSMGVNPNTLKSDYK